MGGGAVGVEGAAQFYFGKSAREVNLAEAAMLAGVFKAGTKLAPHINLAGARSRANVVRDNLVDAGFMTEGQVFGARRNPAIAIDRRDEGAPGYYLDYAFDEMKRLADTPAFRHISDRAFVVRTAIDLGLQRTAEDAVESMIRQFGRDYHAKQAAVVVADLDGAVRAMVGGLDYNTSQFNRATDAYRQPGSSFKPYVYATALMNGFKPTSVVVNGPVWRFDRDDSKKPTQAIPPQVASDMAMMMSHVVEEGTAKRAILDGIKSAGKTGTTNSYRDAWFVGYTGNFVCGVWFGNDDYSPLNRMTGGALPAQTRDAILAYAD